ncbi:MAG TPA: hypothetical protein PKV05_02630 [Bacillota bacterium]|nr:hypothetical protein [Bacillota bacterium]
MKSAMIYQIAEMKKSLLIYYAIMLFLLLASFLTTEVFFHFSANGTTINGIEISSMIFIFVCGLNSFKEPFRMFLQNGLSRKTLFLSYLCSLLPVSGVMAIIDTSIGAIGRSLGSYQSAFHEFYRQYFPAVGPGQVFIVVFALSLMLYTTSALTGYFITSLYYRMSKGLKLLVSIGVPVLLIIVLPIVDMGYANGVISRSIGEILLLASGVKAGYNPLYPLGSCIILSSVLAGLTYLLQRRAVIKEQV